MDVTGAGDLFGGEKSEGGFGGPMHFYRGLSSHQPDPYLSAKMVNPAPAYNGLCRVVLAHCYVGTSQYIKTLSFIVRRCPDPFGMGAATANLGGDANPAFMIYDLMTNPVYGVGTPSSRFDIQSFKDAATTLKDEGMGMSEQIDTAAQADALVSDILRHIDGVMYVDPQTGLWTLKLPARLRPGCTARIRPGRHPRGSGDRSRLMGGHHQPSEGDVCGPRHLCAGCGAGGRERELRGARRAGGRGN